ncbi:MAG: tetratricopeptide repeat protein [Verrucomicrobia bacterium]|nr:tetratricopeptide repeat protein [Verrucomicrobiota bacterium]
MAELTAPTPAPHDDRIFSVALWVVLAFAAAELLAVIIHYGERLREHQAAARTTEMRAAATPATSSPRRAANASPPDSALNPPASSAAVSASDRLLKEATVLRERGDTANALARLQEAAQRDPRNANVLAELATIYESIQLFDRSSETWRKLEALGPSAGPLYELAQSKLRNAVAGAPPAAPVSHTATDSAGKPIDAEGIPEGSLFGITDIKTEQVPDADAETNLRLNIAVRKRPGVSYEIGKLRINVFLYDSVEGKVVLTDADTNSEWLNPRHDWSDTDTETLIVSYRRSKNHAISSEAAISAAAAAITPGKTTGRSKKRGEATPKPQENDAGQRQYLGYVIRVYYNDKLQTVRADPAHLANDAPALP